MRYSDTIIGTKTEYGNTHKRDQGERMGARGHGAPATAAASAPDVSQGGVAAVRLEHRTHFDKTPRQKPLNPIKCRLKNYGDGFAEMGYSWPPPQDCRKTPRGFSLNREANRERSNRRAISRVRQLCMSIRADRLITCTFAKPCEDRQVADRIFTEFVRNVRREVPEWIHVAAIEIQQERYEKYGHKVWHFHVATKGRQEYEQIRRCWMKAAGYYGGNIDVVNPHRVGTSRKVWEVHKLASYLSKYVGKEMGSNAEFEKNRYRYTHGIKVPEEVLEFPSVAQAICFFDNNFGCRYHYEFWAFAGWCASWSLGGESHAPPKRKRAENTATKGVA